MLSNEQVLRAMRARRLLDGSYRVRTDFNAEKDAFWAELAVYRFLWHWGAAAHETSNARSSAVSLFVDGGRLAKLEIVR